jgi:hypothetical protein
VGILWTVWPLNDDMRKWLDEQDIAYPVGPSRFPTGAEIKLALAMLSNYDVKVTDNGPGAYWQASIVHKDGGHNGPWTLLNISNYSGDDMQQELSFEKGWESLITEILQHLSVTCGPLVLIADTGGEPIVIAT